MGELLNTLAISGQIVLHTRSNFLDHVISLGESVSCSLINSMGFSNTSFKIHVFAWEKDIVNTIMHVSYFNKFYFPEEVFVFIIYRELW